MHTESLHDLVAAVEHAVAALNAAVTATGFDIDLDDTELHESVIALEKAKSALEIGSCRVSQSSPGFRIPGHPSPAGGTAETGRTLSPAK